MTTLVPSLLDGSSSPLQITRPTMKAQMSLNFSKIPSLTSEASEKLMNNVVTTLAPSFLIGSSSFLQATSKPSISRMGSKFSRIRPGISELPALERLEKFPYTYVVTTLVLSILNGSSSFLHTIRTIIKVWMFEFRQDSITDFRVSCP